MKTTKTILSVLLTAILTASILCVGVSAEEPTVTSITTDDLTVYQYGDGDWMTIATDGMYITEKYFRYEVTPASYTVTFSDGSAFTGSSYEIYRQAGDWPQIKHDQSATNEWGLGEHTVELSLSGITGSYTVTVIEAPVVSVTASPLILRQHIDGDWRQDGFFHYTIDPVLTVTLTDGRVITGTRWEIHRETGYVPYPSSSQKNGAEWGIGEHEASMSYMGVRADFTATVVDTVTSVELIKCPNQTSSIPYGAYIDLSGGVLRVHFSDGTYEDIATDMTHPGPSFACETLGDEYDADITPSRATTVGQQDITLRFLGETITYPVDVLPVPNSLTLTANTDHSLSLTFEYENESITAGMTDFTFSSGMGMGSSADIEARGWLYTDAGMFYATLIRNGDTREISVALGNAYLDGGEYAISNTITDALWFLEHNGMYLCGDFNNDGEANTSDIRAMLFGITDYPRYTHHQQLVADLNNDGTIDTTDARRILKRLV